MNKLKFFLPVIGFAVLAVLLWRGLYLDTRTLPSMLINKPIPPFALTALDGRPVSNDDLPGTVFLLNVWGSYCLPCLVEHPTFMRLAEEGEIPVVGINYKDGREPALDWLETHGDPFAFSMADPDGRFGIDLGVYGAPETYLVDKDGVIRYRHVSVLDETVWREQFLPAIAELTGLKTESAGSRP